MAYLVYKYKVLNVYYRPFESQGQAWPIACNRIGWALIIFQIFMLGLLSLRQAFLLSTLVLPLILFTVYQLKHLDSVYKQHSKFVCLSQIRESQKSDTGELAESDEETNPKNNPSDNSSPQIFNQLRKSSITPSQANLNVRRYS